MTIPATMVSGSSTIMGYDGLLCPSSMSTEVVGQSGAQQAQVFAPFCSHFSILFGVCIWLCSRIMGQLKTLMLNHEFSHLDGNLRYISFSNVRVKGGPRSRETTGQAEKPRSHRRSREAEKPPEKPTSQEVQRMTRMK